jgi:hypothetical protein
LSFWLFICGALIALGGFITPGGAADFGWTAYVPLSDAIHSPGAGGDLWILGLAVGGLGTILGAVNMITTVVCMRCPGMTMFRMPIFTWNIFVTSILVLLVFPLLTAALFGLAADRRLGAHIYDPANGGLTLFQHLFWYFGHPEVYIIALPFFGIVSEIFPVFSRKPIFGYSTLVYATIAIVVAASCPNASLIWFSARWRWCCYAPCSCSSPWPSVGTHLARCCSARSAWAGAGGRFTSASSERWWWTPLREARPSPSGETRASPAWAASFAAPASMNCRNCSMCCWAT